MRTKPCPQSVRLGRLNKAKQFYKAAQIISTLIDDSELDDAYVTLCVHAGIAAGDVICCVKRGLHAQGQDHEEAVVLLRRARPGEPFSKDLQTLLGMKSLAGYSDKPISPSRTLQALRATERLVLEAERVGSSS